MVSRRNISSPIAAAFEVAIETPNELFESANWSTGGQAMREMLQSQLEVATNVHVDVNDAREELRFLRREVANVAAQYGFVIMACGTHPTAVWRMSQPSPKPRYEEMIEDLRSIGHRNMMCGMHVHVQLPDPEKRMAVMRAMLPHLPLFIALSASSPFWNSHKTGLKGYRLAAYSELPRTGLPELFERQAGLRRICRRVAALRRDPGRKPHLVGDAALDAAPDPRASCARHLHLRRRRRRHRLALSLPDPPPLSAAPSVEEVTAVERAIAVENKWRAQRYGTDCIFASKDGPVTISELLSRVIDDIAEDAAALNCTAEVEHCRTIVDRGSSAEFQLRAYRDNGDDIAAVSRWIATSTTSGRECADRSRALQAPS